MFTLTFSGEVITGYERETVIENLAALLKQSPDNVRQRLFSGKTVIIKRVESEEAALKWRKAFAGAGALLVVSDAQTPENPENDAAHTQPSARYSRVLTEEPSIASANARVAPTRQRNRGYLWMGAIALVMIVLIVALLWLTRPLWQTAELEQEQHSLVAALAMEDTYVLGHVDVARLGALESLAGNETDVQSLPGGEGFWDSLLAAGLNPRSDVEHLWLAGFYRDQEPALVLAATGDFDPERLATWLGERYSVESRDAEGIVFTRIDPTTCEKSEPLLANMDNNRLLVGDRERVRSVIQRLENGAGAQVNLDRWQSVSAPQLASLAVFVPENMGRGMGGLPGMMVQGIGSAASPADGVYLGLDTVALPPGVELSLLVASDDDAFVDSAYTALDSRVTEMRAEAQQRWPEMASFYDRLSVQKRNDGVRAAVRFDQHFKRDLSNWASSLMGGMFGGGGGEPGEESIDENAPQFRNLAQAQLPDYRDYADIPNHFFTPSQTVGPFALGVETLALREDGGLDISISAQGYNLVNLPKRGEAVTLAVEDVEGEGGESLLTAMECGPDNNREPAPLNNVMASSHYVEGESVDYVKVSGSKTLSLPTSVSLVDIERLKGRIEYAQAISVERHTLEAPVAGQSIDAQGVRVRFLGGDEHSLRYQVSGDTDRLLHIYAQNQAGQPLSSGSAMGGPSLFGAGKTWTVNYRGTIARVELVIATELERHSFPFVLDNVYPAAGDIGNLQPQPTLFPSEQWQSLVTSGPPEVTYNWQQPQQEVDAGPLRMAVTELDASDSFGFSFNADVYLSNHFALDGPLGAGELRLTSLTTGDGTEQSVDKRSYFAFAHDGGYWMNGVYQPDEERPWIKGSVSVKDRELKLADVSEVQGYLALLAPISSRQYEMPFNFGVQWLGDNMQLQVNEWESGKISLSWEGDISPLVAVKAYDGERLISQPAKIETMFGDAKIVLEVAGEPTHLQLEVAEEYQREQFPFVINLP